MNNDNTFTIIFFRYLYTENHRILVLSFSRRGTILKTFLRFSSHKQLLKISEVFIDFMKLKISGVRSGQANEVNTASPVKKENKYIYLVHYFYRQYVIKIKFFFCFYFRYNILIKGKNRSYLFNPLIHNKQSSRNYMQQMPSCLNY